MDALKAKAALARAQLAESQSVSLSIDDINKKVQALTSNDKSSQLASAQVNSISDKTEGISIESIPPEFIIIDVNGHVRDRRTGRLVATAPAILEQPKPKAPVSSEAPRPIKRPVKKIEQETPIDKNWDPNLGHYDPSRPKRRRKLFQLIKPGTNIKEAENLKLQRQEMELRLETEAELTATEVLDLKQLQISSEAFPGVEWWDAYLLLNKEDKRYPEEVILDTMVGMEDNSRTVNIKEINSLIHVPPRIPAAISEPSQGPLAVIPTKAEQKKKRRLERLAKAQEQQDLIRAGLIQPNPARLTLNNFMRVLGDFAVSHPSEAEALVRQQMMERQEKHFESNQERKLTKEQKAEKLRKKLDEDTSEGVHVCVLRVGDMSSGKTRFKVQTNAEQYNLTGIVIIQPDCNLIVAEGGEKNIKKYTALITRRMKWDEIKLEADEELIKKTENEQENISSERFRPGRSKNTDCQVIYTGIISKRLFSRFSTEMCATRTSARSLLERSGCVQYWDMCLANANKSLTSEQNQIFKL